ncbi:MAG: IS256 family transposase [Anaerococcus sp.]|nr:IS256 family transposase [Anaerococcus sp.]
MNNFNTDLIQILTQGLDINEFFRQQLEIAINDLLKSELTVFLDYEKWEYKGYGSGNSRNGYYHRNLKTRFGELELQIPRDRAGEFKQETVKAYARNTDNLENMVITLYKKGITTREIADLLEKMYGNNYSPTTISNISKVMKNEIEAYHNRKIKKDFVVLYCDATYLPVRRDSVAKEALHVIIGIDPNGNKEVLDYSLFPEESANNYKEMLINLKSRGLENVLLFVSDGLVGLKEAVTDIFPKSKHQTCWTHLMRNIENKVRAKDKLEVANDAKLIYTSDDIESAEKRLTEFLSKWSIKYPKLRKMLEGKDNLFTFMLFPKAIRRSLYTNNICENFNKDIKRKLKQKVQFPNEESLDKAIYIPVSEYNNKFSNRTHIGFGLVRYELKMMIEKISDSPSTTKSTI